MIALSTGSLYCYGIDRVFGLAAETGFDGIEVMVDDRWDTRQADYLNQLQTSYGLPIASVHSPFAPEVDGWEDHEVHRVGRSVALAESVGAHTVVVHLPRRWSRWGARLPGLVVDVLFGPRRCRDEEYLAWLLDELPAFQAATDVTIAVENMPVRRVLGRAVNPYRLNSLGGLEQFEHLTLDTTHLGTWHADILEVYGRVADRVAHVHLSNYNGHEHRLLTDGHLPLAELLRSLKTDGYQGIITVELNPHSLGADVEDRVRANLRDCVAFCRKHFDGSAFV